MRVMILGCGRLGAALALDLDRKGHQITVLDVSGDAFTRLPSSFTGTKVQGDGLDVDVLREAGVADQDAFVATTQGDNRNLMASQIALRVFGVPVVVSRVSDPLRGQIFSALGIQPVSPTLLGADMIYNALLGTATLRDCS
jgi:trk system potassium uptake protein TrkA